MIKDSVPETMLPNLSPSGSLWGRPPQGGALPWMVACTVVHSPPNSRWQELSLYFLAQDCFTRFMEAPQSREFVYALVQREVNGEQLPVKTVSFGLVSSATHRALIFVLSVSANHLWLDLGRFTVTMGDCYISIVFLWICRQRYQPQNIEALQASCEWKSCYRDIAL